MNVSKKQLQEIADRMRSLESMIDSELHVFGELLDKIPYMSTEHIDLLDMREELTEHLNDCIGEVEWRIKRGVQK